MNRHSQWPQSPSMERQKSNAVAAAENTATGASFRQQIRRFLLRLNEGNAIVETALVLPILMMLMMAIYSIGTAYSNQLSLTNAVQQGAIAVSMQYDGGDLCQTASNAIVAAAPTLNPATITYTLVVNNTSVYPTVSSGASSYGPTKGSFSCGGAPQLSEGTGANITVMATYPCNLNLYGLSVASSCTLPPAVSTVPIQ